MNILKEKIVSLLDTISEEDMQVLSTVAERLSEWEATQEILEDKKMMVSIRKGLKELEEGQTISLQKLQKNV